MLGRWQRGKHQESVSPPRQLHWHNLSAVTVLEFWICWRFATSRKNVDSKLLLILVNFSSWHNSSDLVPTSQPCSRQLCTCSWSSLYTACGRHRVGSNDPVLQVQGICDIVAASDHRGTDKKTGSHCCCTTPTVERHHPSGLGDLQGT